MTIATLGNDVLRQKARTIADIDGRIAEVARDMLLTMRSARGIGLAGPQVGLSERIFVCGLADDVERVFINPQIVETSQELEDYEEGCLSVPGIWADVRRPSALRVQAWNENGRPFTLDAEGILARVIQHEIDHLDGVLFLDRLSDVKRDRLIAQYDKKFRA